MAGRGLAYNPALDGVRAVAVVAVLLFHGGWTSGGFLGVDVFFVLSGFLITSLLVTELDRRGRIDLRSFWARRARRLLPALALVLVAVLLVLPALGVVWPSGTRGDAWATVFYVSNWWFVLQGQSYAAVYSDPSPLQHTWSLAIEEQWYLLFPLMLAGAVWLVARGRIRISRQVGGLLLLGGALVSAAWGAVLTAGGADAARVYYGTDTRVLALLVGAGLALLVSREMPRRVVAAQPWLAAVGAVGLLALFALAGEESPWLYRGGFLLVAVLAGLLVVGVADGSGRGVGRVLSWRPVVLVGVVSYGLYLWHWPLFLALSPQRTGMDGPALFALQVAVTALVATASFVLLERPVRTGRWPGGLRLPRPAAVAGVAAGTAVVVAAVALSPQPQPAPDSIESLEQVAAALRAPQAAAPAVAPEVAPSRRAPRTVLFVGDSNALSIYAAARDRAGRRVTLAMATRFGCGVVPYTAAIQGRPVSSQQPLCDDWVAAREKEIAAADADVAVLFAGSWEQYDRWIGGRPVSYTDRAWVEATSTAYAQVLREMRWHAPRVVVVLNHCHSVPDVALPAAQLFQAGRYPPVVNSAERVAATNAAARLAAATVGFPVRVVDPNPFLCRAGYTPTLDGVRLRTDGLHFTTAGGRLVWNWLRPRVLASG
jgi:peptidoglycan/LPS O-acetylase OafA/YrhL